MTREPPSGRKSGPAMHRDIEHRHFEPMSGPQGNKLGMPTTRATLRTDGRPDPTIVWMTALQGTPGPGQHTYTVSTPRRRPCTGTMDRPAVTTSTVGGDRQLPRNRPISWPLPAGHRAPTNAHHTTVHAHEHVTCHMHTQCKGIGWPDRVGRGDSGRRQATAEDPPHPLDAHSTRPPDPHVP